MILYVFCCVFGDPSYRIRVFFCDGDDFVCACTLYTFIGDDFVCACTLYHFIGDDFVCTCTLYPFIGDDFVFIYMYKYVYTCKKYSVCIG